MIAVLIQSFQLPGYLFLYCVRKQELMGEINKDHNSVRQGKELLFV